MLRSMTGYGRGESYKYDRKFIVEIRSVNHRYNDLSIKMPKIMNGFEDRIRKIISKAISRGKTDVYVNYQTFSGKDVKINFNEALSDAYFEEIKKISDRYNFGAQNYLEILTQVDGILTVDNSSFDDNTLNEMWEALEEALNISISQSIHMRQTEGNSLKNDIIHKSGTINEMTGKIKERYPSIIVEYRERLKTRVKEALENVSIDETRLLTEVTLFADKSCIDEELTRLFSHVNQLVEIVNFGGIVGRKLDFLIQEMNREVNTIGSKSNDIEITKIVVDLKSEIEKIREQIQNIE